MPQILEIFILVLFKNNGFNVTKESEFCKAPNCLGMKICVQIVCD